MTMQQRVGADGAASPRVFVTYSHDSDEHKELVRRFGTFLRVEAGVDVHLDQWYEGERRDWSRWAIDQLKNADFVVVIASPEYKHRADGLAPADVGRGAQFEAAIIRDNLTRNLPKETRRVLPVVLPGRSIEDIPTFLAGHSTTHYIVSEFTLDGIKDLLVAFTGIPQYRLPPLGRFVGSPFAGEHQLSQPCDQPSPAGETTVLPVGTQLWRVHPRSLPVEQFVSTLPGRHAVLHVSRRQVTALVEELLRGVKFGHDGERTLAHRRLAGKSLSAMRTTRELTLAPADEEPDLVGLWPPNGVHGFEWPSTLDLPEPMMVLLGDRCPPSVLWPIAGQSRRLDDAECIGWLRETLHPYRVRVSSPPVASQ